jgi:hypothetical protein
MEFFPRSFLLALTLSGILCSAVSADPVEFGSDILGRVPAPTVQQVSNFLQHFVDSSKQPDEHLALYKDVVDYFGRGEVSKTEILRDMKRYRKQWPLREYRVSRIDFILPDPQSDSVYVRYEVIFSVTNPAKARRITGRGAYGAVISDIDGTPQIAAIYESVIARKRSSNAKH